MNRGQFLSFDLPPSLFDLRYPLRLPLLILATKHQDDGPVVSVPLCRNLLLSTSPWKGRPGWGHILPKGCELSLVGAVPVHGVDMGLPISIGTEDHMETIRGPERILVASAVPRKLNYVLTIGIGYEYIKSHRSSSYKGDPISPG